MGGSGASKPMVEPPKDWEPQGGTRSFEVISPCSDLSNPSDFNRVRYNRNSRQYQLNQGESRHENKRSSPRKVLAGQLSKTKKSGDYNPHELPVAVKVRRSNSTAGSRRGEIVAPGAFYFPTKESERQADYLAKKEARMNHPKIIINRNSKNSQSNRGSKGKTKGFKSLARRAAKKMKKRKDAVKRVAFAVGHACLEETRKKMILDNPGLNATRPRRSAGESEVSRRNMDRKHSGSLRSRRRSEQIALGALQATIPRHDVPLSKLKKDCDIKKNNRMIRDNSAKNVERHQNQMDRVTSVALHQADAYFERLSLSPSENAGASPFVRHGTAIASSNRITSILQSTSKKTPKDRTRRLSLDSPIDSPVSDLFSANDSVPNMRDNEYLIASMRSNNASPVSSLMRFYTKSGPMESTPKSYCSDTDEALGKVFSDEQSEDSGQRRNIAQTSRDVIRLTESQDSHSSLYTNESKSYKKANSKYLKLLAHHDHEKESDTLHSYIRAEQKKGNARKITKHEPKGKHPKVSKLESLFRPILPALSTDDAQSVHSYDPHEIKVTESAPGAIQATNNMAYGFRSSTPQNVNDGSPSISVASIDSQRERSSNSANHMVSNQARHNAEFLFTDDYGPIVVAQNPDKARDNSTFSISTAGSRSRLTQKSTQKGVIIPMKNLKKEVDDISFDSRSTKSERRVRFSEGSARLLQKRGEVLEIKENPFDGLNNAVDDMGRQRAKTEERGDSDVPSDEETETDEALHERFATKPPHMKFHKFSRNVTRINSVDESIDLPEIESKMSDVSESACKTSRKSLESARSIRSNQTIPDRIQEEDEKTTVSKDSSIHWTKTNNGVTPFVRGKSTVNPTKSPYYRYQDAKTKFNTQNPIQPEPSHKKTKSPRKSLAKSFAKSPAKSPAKIMRKGSGGLVSTRILELNTRVSEARKLKRLRKKTTNPRLHTHNFDNAHPVRSRALINYKTNYSGANIKNSNNVMAAKFNMIPDIDDDDDSITFLPGNNHNYIVSSGKEDIEDDDVSRMSEITGATIATVRQRRSSRGYSMTSRTTASSGLTNLKKQVFCISDDAKSVTSRSDSTMVSTVVHKDIENRLPFRGKNTGVTPSKQHFVAPKQTMLAPPSRGTPAMKWRSLAAAAAEKDALKMSSSKPRKILGTRSNNCDQYEIYGFKD